MLGASSLASMKGRWSWAVKAFSLSFFPLVILFLCLQAWQSVILSGIPSLSPRRISCWQALVEVSMTVEMVRKMFPHKGVAQSTVWRKKLLLWHFCLYEETVEACWCPTPHTTWCFSATASMSKYLEHAGRMTDTVWWPHGHETESNEFCLPAYLYCVSSCKKVCCVYFCTRCSSVWVCIL